MIFGTLPQRSSVEQASETHRPFYIPVRSREQKIVRSCGSTFRDTRVSTKYVPLLTTLALLAASMITSAQTPLTVTRVSPLSSSVSPGNGMVVVQWSGGTAPYQVQYRSLTDSTWLDLGGINNGTVQTNVMIEPSALYRVASVSGYSKRSDITPPSQVTGLSATVTSCNQINLSWNPATDNVGVKSYNIYRNGLALTSVLAPVTSYSDTSCTGQTSYSYTVTAVDASHNQSTPSTAATATTPPCGSCIATVSTSSSPSAGGSTSGDAAVACGSSVTLTATANSGYTFSNWSLNGSPVSTSPSYTFSASASESLVANFTSNQGVTSGTWAKSFGGPADYDAGVCILVDGTGYNYVAGYFQGSIDLGGGLLTSAGGQDMFLAKYSSTGVFQWAVRYGGAGDDVVTCMAFDRAGNILVAGNAGIGMLKYSPQGSLLWSSQGLGGAVPTGIAADSQNNVLLTGYYKGTAVIGPNTFNNGSGQGMTFIAKFSSAGAGIWSWTPWGNGQTGGWNQGAGIAADSSDNIIVGGYFQSTIGFGGGQRSNPGGFLVKFSSSGTYMWDSIFGTIVPNTFSGSARVGSFKLDGNGDVLIGGDFSGSVNFGGGTVTGTAQAGIDLFLAKYSGSNGAYVWAKPILGGIGSNGQICSITTDSQNNVIITGYFGSPGYTFGNTPLSTGGWNLNYSFLAKYSSAGTVAWAQAFGGSSGVGDCGNAVATDSSGYPVMTGAYSAALSISGQNVTSLGVTDVLLAKFNP